MIRLFSETATDFSGLGLGVLPDAISGTVEESLNGAYELSMTYPINGLRYDELSLGRVIMAKPDPFRNPQPFDIYRVTKSMNGTVEVLAQHLSHRLSKIPVQPFNAASLSSALTGLRNNAMVPCPFTFRTDKTVAAPYVQTVPASIRQRLGGEEGSILDLYGGEYEWDGWTVSLWNHRGQDRGVTIRYGKNLTDFVQENDGVDVASGVVPYWAGTDENGEEITVYSPNIIRKTGRSGSDIVPLDLSSAFDEQPTIEQLDARAQAYVDSSSFGVPKVNMKVSFIDLRNTTEYASIAPLEQVMLGDTVSIYYPTYNITASARVIKTRYNILTNNYDVIELGNAQSSLATTIKKLEEDTDADVDKAISESEARQKSFFEQALEDATDLIAGGQGGYVVLRRNADGTPYEILILDHPDIEDAINCIRINNAGIAFSQSGYNGNFTSAWTIDGSFLAYNINVLRMSASAVTTDELKSQNYDSSNGTEGFSLDLTTGIIHANSITVALNDVEDSLQENIDEAQSTADKAKDVADKTAKYFRYGTWGSKTGAAVVNGKNMVLVTGDQLLFIQNYNYDAPVAQLDQQKLVVTHGIFNDDLTIGRFKWIPRSNGNLSLVYVGG